jgi:hypothetical protein
MFEPLRDHLQAVLLLRHTLHAAQYQLYTLKITLSRSKQVGLSYSINKVVTERYMVHIITIYGAHVAVQSTS